MEVFKYNLDTRIYPNLKTTAPLGGATRLKIKINMKDKWHQETCFSSNIRGTCKNNPLTAPYTKKQLNFTIIYRTYNIKLTFKHSSANMDSEFQITSISQLRYSWRIPTTYLANFAVKLQESVTILKKESVHLLVSLLPVIQHRFILQYADFLNMVTLLLILIPLL